MPLNRLNLLIGTAAMLQPFLQGDFDLQERSKSTIPVLEHSHRSNFFQSAEKVNIEVMKALATAGARFLVAENLIEVFGGTSTSQSCGKRDTIPFIELSFAVVDFEGC
jgi:hypothetical protein